MLAELQSLAVLAASDPNIVLKTGEPDCNWSYNWQTRTITVNPCDLALRPADYCRGLTLHESAHAALTRIAEIVPSDIHQGDVHLLLNIVEDCRIENWLQQRFPGCRPWIKLYNDRILNLSSDEAGAILTGDPAGGFLAGLLELWWHGVLPPTVHPESLSAIEEVTPYFNEAIAAFPGPDLPDALHARDRYDAHPVSINFRALDRNNEPSPEEMEIRMLQHRAWTITSCHILPVLRRLLNHPDSGHMRRHISELNERNASHERSAAEKGGVAKGRFNSRWPGSHSRSMGASHPAAFGPARDYARAVSKYGDLIESCGNVLLRLLTAESRPQRTRFHRSGHALDLRVAMQAEADPRLHEKLWQRTTLPEHPNPAFVVLIDSSGSMHGMKAEASFAAVVVIREVCLRLGIALTIICFDTHASILQSWDSPHAADVPSGVAGLLTPRGGTRMSPALELAGEIFDEDPHLHRYLWILSDGDTEEFDDARRQLQDLRNRGVTIHGLGLGPGCDDIATLVPGAQTNLTPDQLPTVFATLLGSNLRSHA